MILLSIPEALPIYTTRHPQSTPTPLADVPFPLSRTMTHRALLRLFLLLCPYAYFELPSRIPFVFFASSATSPSSSTITLLSFITCRRGSPSSLSWTLTHYAYRLIFLSPISCTVLRLVVVGLSQAFLVFNLS